MGSNYEKKVNALPKTLDGLLEAVQQRMKVEHFSGSSIKSYLNSARQLCLFTSKLPHELQEQEILDFLSYLVSDKHCSRETVRNYLQGIRYMYRRVYRRADVAEMSLDATEFLRRFSMHILPRGFMKIRHYGILSSRAKKGDLASARKSLNAIAPPSLNNEYI